MYPSWLGQHQQIDLFKGKLSGVGLTSHNSRVVVDWKPLIKGAIV